MNSTCELARHGASALKPYPAYRDSGVEWLGEVPAHWEVRRLKNVASLVMGQSPVSEDCSTARIGLPFLQGCAEFGADHPRPVQFCRKPAKVSPVGAILMSVRAPVGRLNVADQRYGIGRGLCAVAPHISSLDARFCRYNLDRSAFGLTLQSTGSTYDAVSVGDVACLPTVVPPIPEQTAIVRFLDHADRRIRRYIRAKQKLIALLEEQKRAVIHQVVTGQIDVRTGEPYGEYKASGVEWLASVPAHWERCRLKALLQTVDRRSITGGETLLSLRRDYGVVIYSDHFTRPPQGGSLVGFKLLQAGQLVVNRMQASNGLIFFSTLDGVVSPDYSVFEQKRSVRMEHLCNLLRVCSYRAHFRRESTGLGTGTAGFLRLYDDKFLDTSVFLPPLHEQDVLVEHLRTATTDVERVVGYIRRQIDSLGEYRTRLISDVVTGKLDVREAAAGLPEVDPLAVEGDSVDGVDHEAGSERTGWRHAVEEGGPLADGADP